MVGEPGIGSIAQSAEQRAFNPTVGGSIPSGPINDMSKILVTIFSKWMQGLWVTYIPFGDGQSPYGSQESKACPCVTPETHGHSPISPLTMGQRPIVKHFTGPCWNWHTEET